MTRRHVISKWSLVLSLGALAPLPACLAPDDLEGNPEAQAEAGFGESAQAILNASRTPATEGWFQGTVGIKAFLPAGAGTKYCTGTFISPRVILTAAECASSAYNKWTAKAENYTAANNVFDAWSAAVYPGGNNVGLLFTDPTLPGINLSYYPYVLPNNAQYGGSTCVNVGAGTTGQLFKGPVSNFNGTPPAGYVATYAVSSVLFEVGDEGGPAFLSPTTGMTYYLIGVNARGPNGESLIARTDADVATWIASQVAAHP
jgi:hypothetical protein